MKRPVIAFLLFPLLGLASIAQAEISGRDACKSEFNSIKEKLKKNPQDSNAWNEFRACVNELKRWNDGAHVAHEALEKNKDIWQAHLLLGISTLHTKEYEKAAQSFRKATELKTDSAAPYYYLGMAYLFQGESDDAVAAASKAVELEGANANYHSQLAYALLLTDNRERAESEAKKAIELDGNNVAAYKVLGNLYKRLGRQEEADMAFEEAIHANGRLAAGTPAVPGRTLAALPGMAAAPVRAVPTPTRTSSIPAVAPATTAASSEDPDEKGPGLIIAFCRDQWASMRNAIGKGDTERALTYFSDYADTREQYRQAFQKLGLQRVVQMFSNMGDVYDCKVTLGVTTCKAAVTTGGEGTIHSSEVDVRFERNPDKMWRIRSF